jgi:hypothetical protein
MLPLFLAIIKKDLVMLRRPQSLLSFKDALRKEKIHVVIRQNANGIIYGLTYVDVNTKCVFNGSDIGKEYCAKSILEKCGIGQFNPLLQRASEKEIINSEKFAFTLNKSLAEQNLSNMVNALITPIEQNNYIPHELTKRQKKRHTI